MNNEKLILGIELGSTRIKSVLINERTEVVASGAYSWENKLTDGLWSYELDEVIIGLQESYRKLILDFGKSITHLDAIGISGMMHGYLAFDADMKLLAPFRTWRNTNASAAAEELSELFGLHLPMRWSVSQYYQSVLDGLDHVKKIKRLTTLAGYVHLLLTGKNCLGYNDASGMFPMKNGDYNKELIEKFDRLLEKRGTRVKFRELLPLALGAGECAGHLTEEGALLLDPTGTLLAGVPLCPPEGDMGTGMICTNCVTPRTANLSLGTSSNMTVVLEGELEGIHPELDAIMTPDGHPAVILHANTCTSVIDSWVGIFAEAMELAGARLERDEIYRRLFEAASSSDHDLGGVVAYNFLAAEPIVDVESAAPTVFCKEGGRLTLSNFMQAQIYAAVAAIKMGLDNLSRDGVTIERVSGHGGYFKTPKIGQSAVSALVGAPVTVTSTAAEGGAYGIGLLALYMLAGEKSLSDYLKRIFDGKEKTVLSADGNEIEKFGSFMENYKAGLDAVRVIALIKDK